MRVSLLDGELNVSNETLMKIPYFSALLRVHPDLKETHLDYEKSKFLEILNDINVEIDDYLGVNQKQSYDNGFYIKKEEWGHLSSIITDNSIYLFKNGNRQHIPYLMMISDKGNYKLRVIYEKSCIKIIYKKCELLSVCVVRGDVLVDKQFNSLFIYDFATTDKYTIKEY